MFGRAKACLVIKHIFKTLKNTYLWVRRCWAFRPLGTPSAVSKAGAQTNSEAKRTKAFTINLLLCQLFLSTKSYLIPSLLSPCMKCLSTDILLDSGDYPFRNKEMIASRLGGWRALAYIGYSTQKQNSPRPEESASKAEVTAHNHMAMRK